MALGGVVNISVPNIPFVSGIEWQTSASLDRARCAHAQTLFTRVMNGDMGTATDDRGRLPMPILDQINRLRQQAATSTSKACYQQVWEELIKNGKVPGQGSAAGATPLNQQASSPGSVGQVNPVTAGAAGIAGLPWWLLAATAGLAVWSALKKKG